MRRAKGLVGVFAGVMFLIHAGTTAYADEKGNNGTIKIHETGTSDDSNANEPHVCNFHINGNGFDASSSGTWKIEQDPNGSTVVASGNWAANTSGDWRTNDVTLPDGHYRASAKQTSPATSGGDKQKVLWVKCGETATAGSNTENAANNGGNNSDTSGSTGAAGGETASSGFGNVPPPGSTSSMGAAPGVSSLPSTSSESNAPLGALGMVILGLGALLLRRPSTR